MPVYFEVHGVVIYMNYNDHQPPHFHARCQSEEVIVGIEAGVVTGTMSKRPPRMVLDWADARQAELLEDWKLARERKPLKAIPPLDQVVQHAASRRQG